MDPHLYIEEKGEYSETKKVLDASCEKLNVSLIYVIKVDTSDYGRFESIFNSVNNSVGDTNYTEWELGHKRYTTNDEYRAKYQAIYEQEAEYETVFRMHTDGESHPHLTSMIPIKNTEGEVTSILCVERPISEIAKTFTPYLIYIFINVAVMVVLISFLASGFLRRSIIDPVEKVSAEASRFARESTLGEPLGYISRFHEIRDLARSIDAMEADTLNYVDRLTTMAAEREKVVAEMSIAATIQQDALPADFPPFPDRTEFDLYASMDPARAVGGDFYDFLLVDDDHLALVMADVSGKGIPGALFMMTSDLIISSLIREGIAPSEILRRANDNLSVNNHAEMFVTVWLGILEISTGYLIYANAGHEYPAVCQNGAGFQLVKGKHGFVLGGMEGMKYRDEEIQLAPGSKLFLYTDGVPEATDIDNNMFGTDRMLESLNADLEADPEEILGIVRSRVDDFVRDAEQFDDLTMLCLKYNGTL